MTGRRKPGTVEVGNHQRTERSVEMLMTGVRTEVRRTEGDDARRHVLEATRDRDPAVLVPEKQLNRWINEGGAVLPND